MGHGFLIPPFFILIWVVLNGFVNCQQPMVVNIGAIFAYNSVIGRVAKIAIKAAADDINANQNILRGIKLKFILADSECSVFLGSIGAFHVLEGDVVALIGPQSSSIAHMISFIANGLQVPLISFAATDPTLSALQFPFFLRSTQSDSCQMAAMADLINFYGWHEVVSIFVDDDYGRSGISSLEDELAKRMAKTYKIPLPVRANRSDIASLLEKSKSIGARVYVVHVAPDSGLTIFSVAHQLQMMTSGYAWLATDWLSTTLDSSVSRNTPVTILQGVIGLRQYMPPSNQKKAFRSRWKELRQKGLVTVELNNYGLYAYDTVWAVAHSIDEYLKNHGNITFSYNENLQNMNHSSLQLGKLKTFDGGNLLLDILQKTDFTGVTGRVEFDSERNLIGSGYEVINVDSKGIQRIGYWSNYSGFSIAPPVNLNGTYRSDWTIGELKNASWPGGKKDRPRGWVIATNEKPLRIGIPNRASFVEFVTEVHKSHKIQGYCIDVFKAALKFIPYNIPHRFEAFGDGHSNPSFDELVRMVAEDVFDAAVGDITIVTNRTRIADFTQPYAANGLVIVIPLKDTKSSAWVFLKPFTVEMWCVTAGFFIVVGVVIWILEHRINDDFRGPPKQQVITMLLFSFSTLFKTNQESTVSSLGKFVMMVWLFLLMVITSSYTASLTSILTVEQLSSPITGIDTLIASNQPIGYQEGSFVKSYLTNSLNIHPSRLLSLANPEEYAKSLQQGPKNGGVAAIVDELPYIELFLSKYTEFGMVGQMFTRSGWGFAFKRGSPLAVDMSTAILKLVETGELEKIHKEWFCKLGCVAERTHHSDPNQLHLSSFWGLFLLCAIVTLLSLLVFFLRTVRQFIRYKKAQRNLSPSPSSEASNTRCSHVVYTFFDFIDEKEEAIKRMFKQCDHPEQQVN
ncbi:hypothetical protein AQUCO_07700053v1 [Aquilegia coerulea]|uniref:Glutamate receptor n=1 Tax=Aquilegia coerulea TaxID=218851 RepID=A0A2G5C8A2_AQUCA|nr:hypothetical protein AQUCO_07700053v1 [Aquilegia coerulea]